MPWNLDSDRPIFIQIIERIQVEDTAMINNLKSELAQELVTQFLENMQKLGIPQEEALSIISETIKGDEHHDTD